MKFYDSMGFESKHGIWVRRVDAEARIRELEAENYRLNMEMAAYRQGCTPKDAVAMLAVVDALEVEKQDRRSRFDSRRCPNMAHKRYNLYLCTECSLLSDAGAAQFDRGSEHE